MCNILINYWLDSLYVQLWVQFFSALWFVFCLKPYSTKPLSHSNDDKQFSCTQYWRKWVHLLILNEIVAGTWGKIIDDLDENLFLWDNFLDLSYSGCIRVLQRRSVSEMGKRDLSKVSSCIFEHCDMHNSNSETAVKFEWEIILFFFSHLFVIYFKKSESTLLK